jgi:hypothetical protein
MFQSFPIGYVDGRRRFFSASNEIVMWFLSCLYAILHLLICMCWTIPSSLEGCMRFRICWFQFASIFFLLFICAYNVWVISPPLPLDPSLTYPTSSLSPLPVFNENFLLQCSLEILAYNSLFFVVSLSSFGIV